MANDGGKCPYNGAQLKVASVNHKKQKNDSVFKSQLSDNEN